MTLWGMLAGGLGFTLGQSVQAFHAWNMDQIKNGLFASIYPFINWWNMMEITFGVVYVCNIALDYGTIEIIFHQTVIIVLSNK